MLNSWVFRYFIFCSMMSNTKIKKSRSGQSEQSVVQNVSQENVMDWFVRLWTMHKKCTELNTAECKNLTVPPRRSRTFLPLW